MPAEAIVAHQAAQNVHLHRLLATSVVRAWSSVADLSDASADRWTATIVPLVSGAQRAIAASTRSYLARLITDVSGEPFEPSPLPDLTALRGVPPSELYRRPIATARTYAGAGWPLAEALRRGGQRAVTLAATDLQLAATHTARAVLSGA